MEKTNGEKKENEKSCVRWQVEKKIKEEKHK